MLSRDADSCYWIGRYVERAEATARMVDVHYHAAPGDVPAAGAGRDARRRDGRASARSWHSLLAISGNADRLRRALRH